MYGKRDHLLCCNFCYRQSHISERIPCGRFLMRTDKSIEITMLSIEWLLMNRCRIMYCRTDSSLPQSLYPLVPLARHTNSILMVDMAISCASYRCLYNFMKAFC